MKRILLIISTIVVLFGCEETIQLDLDQTPTRYVIDGLITDEMTKHYVKVSTSTDFYADGAPPRVSGAVVEVTDDAGNNYLFSESETDKGRYEAEFEGIPGRTYHLAVTLPNGEDFSASDKLIFMPPIVDSLVWEIDEKEQNDPDEEGFYYKLRIFGKEPQATKDYYLFKFYRNDTIQNFDSQTGIFFADDELIGEFIYGLEAPVYYKEGDNAQFEMYHISRDGYLFYNDLNNIVNGDGGMFGPSPTNPRTNIQNANGLGLGLFQVSAVEKSAIIVGE
jgi:hypothetical protein